MNGGRRDGYITSGDGLIKGRRGGRGRRVEEGEVLIQARGDKETKKDGDVCNYLNKKGE